MALSLSCHMTACMYSIEAHTSANIRHVMQLREGVRTKEEALALGRQVVDCPALHLRGLMTHHGNLEVFQPIIDAFKDTFGQVSYL